MLRTGTSTDFTGQKAEYKVTSQSLDSAYDTETKYNPQFNKWHGYYRKIPEFRAVINKLASWTFGRGIKADKGNEAKLKKIKGWGKDSSRTVLKNLWRVALICGDAFGHIVKDGQGRMTNLKPLNSQNVSIVANDKGIIIGYELSTVPNKRYSPEEIFHLSYERLGDEIHGIPFAEALESMILTRNELIADLRVLYHRNIKPIQFFEVETSDTDKLTDIATTINNAYAKTENVIIPHGVIKEIKKTNTPQYGNLDSLNFLKFVVRQFVTACGVPEVVMGWGEETTEASSKIIYLAFQQEIEDMQLYIQEMAEIQLNIKFNLEFPASLEGELQQDQKKDAGYQTKVKVGSPAKDTK